MNTGIYAILVIVLGVDHVLAGAPTFTNLPRPSVPLREDIRVQTSFYTVSATDPDGDILQYTITGPIGVPFIIDPGTGVVSVSATPGLNFEARSKYKLQIQVNDGTQVKSSTLTVDIADVDEPPVFKDLPSTATIPENWKKWTILKNISAIDPEGEHVTYTLTSPLGAPFEISPEGMLVMRADPYLDFEHRRQYTLTIAAFDGTLSTLSTFVVNITDVNDPPQILNMGDKITVPMNTVGNIFNVHAIDEDNDKLVYSLVTYPNNTEGCPFSLDLKTGGLSVDDPPGLNPNVNNMCTVHITVTDSHGANTTGLLYVEIVHKMDTPEIWNLPNAVYMFENRTTGATIFTPRTIDLTAQGKLSYHMTVYPSDRHGKFYLDPITGKVSVHDNPGFDFEKRNKYDISITVSNGVTTSRRHQLHVRIKNSNERPWITSIDSTFTVPEDTVNGKLIHQVTATDPDAQTTLSYLMTVEPPSGKSKFSIDEWSGKISVVSNPDLDFETQNQYTLIVRASDGLLKSDPKKFNIDITNVNEPPIFPSSPIHVTIPEEMLTGGLLPVSCDATDPDKDDKLFYQLVSSQFSDVFKVDHSSSMCRLVFNKRLDSEDNSTPDAFNIDVLAIDTGGLPATLSLTINVDNINDNAPIFSKLNYEVELLENRPTGTPVVDVVATDKDVRVFGVLSYRIQTAPADYYFHASPKGRISVRALVDRENIQKMTFNVIAQDGGKPPKSATATVTVTILDDNDHRPVFQRQFYDFEARTDTPMGTSVGNVHATDSDDANASLKYFLLGISEEFVIGLTSGDLWTKQSLLPNRTYLLNIVAEDSGSPTERSKAVGIRVDTYVCSESLLRVEVNRMKSFFDSSGRSQFIRALGDDVFPGFVSRISDVKIGQKAGTSVVLTYFVRSNKTQSVTRINEAKQFVSVSEILHSTTTDGEDTPNLRLSTGSFARFPVTKISCECCGEDINWWLDTTEGKVTTGILSTVGAALLIGATGILVSRAASRFFGDKIFGSGRIKPQSKGLLGKRTKIGYNDKQNWWKLQPKAAFDNPSALEEKFRPPTSEPVSTKNVKMKLPNPPVKAYDGRPLPGGETGLEF